jgi:RHS repeat-associated protein
MPAGGSTRWSRIWYLEKTGQLDAKLSFDISDAGLSPEVDLGNRLANYKLIYKPAIGDAFAVVNNGSEPVVPTLENGDQMSFSLSDSQISSGYYTIMVTESTDSAPVEKSFSGLITSTQWRTDQPYLVTEPGHEGMYMYTYDEKYQIKDARFAENVNHTLGTFDRAGNKFRLTDMSYDPNGNILTMKRFDKDALRQHSFHYTYKPNTNQLQNINGYTNAYTYNAVGQMIGEDKVEEGKDQFVDYDVTGKVRFVYSDALKKNKKVEYLYDDRGFRLAKVNYETQRTTWYIRDASGNVVSINEQVGTPTGLYTDIAWGSLSNVVVDPNGKLTVASPATTGTAYSSTHLKPNQDGYFEYVIEDAGVQKDIAFQQVGYSSAYMYRFNFYAGSNIVTIRRGGVYQGRIDYVVGDVLRLVRTGGNVHFYHNNTLRLTLPVSTSVSLQLYVGLGAANAKISNLAFKYTSDPTGDQFAMNNTEVPIYGAGKLGTYYPQQDSSMNYEITDHLGNIRALVRDNISIYTATMEDNGQQGESNPRNEETTYFQNIPETVVTDVRMNHTSVSPGVVPNKAAYLFWNDTQGTLAEDKAIGPAIALRVNAGDAINVEAWSRFERKNDYTHDFGLVALSALLGNTFATSGGFDGLPLNGTISNLEQALTAAAFPDDGGDDTRPFAYVNYILYDENMVYQSAGWRRVSDEAGFYPNEIGLPEKKPVRVGFDEPIEVSQSGYIYVWVSNQSKETKVWFDDLRVTYTQHILVQATDYGVWGDVLREQKTDESVYRFGYQGKYSERDDETGWNHFEAREYDPVTGRWTSKDPAGQFQSPYLGMGNNPVSNVDPDGRRIIINRFLRKDLVYENGSLYNMDGSAYTGRVGGFLGKRFDALNNLNSVAVGASRLRTLESSPFDFVIKRGSNEFIPNSLSASVMALNAQVSGTAIPAGVTVGSGGVIKWKPGDFTGDLNSAGSNQRPSFIGLGHELLGHAYGASQGMSDRRGHPSGLFTMDEFNAVHVENLLRAQWHLPLRTNYGPQLMINRGSAPFSSYFYGQNGYYYDQVNYQRHYSGPHSGR